MIFSQRVLDKAKEIADGCQGKHKAFCTVRCPMHTDVLSYVSLIGEGKLEDSLSKIREKLFLPGTLGRICSHPCEDDCRRNTEFEQPISIAALKRYAADRAENEELWDLTKKSATGKKIAIVGAGPGGAQAALDLAKDGHDVTVYEKLSVVGGMLRVGIPDYRLPRDIIDFEYSYLSKLGVKFKMGVEIGRDVKFETLLKDYDAVIVANGAHKSLMPKLNVPTDTTGIMNAVDFLRGVSLGDEKVIDSVGENVLVIGGGDAGIDCVRTVLRVGAKKSGLVTRRQTVPASPYEQECAQEEGVDFYCGWGNEEILTTDGRVSSLIFKECVSVFDKDGNYNPTFSDKTMELPCDTVIYASSQLVEDATDGMLEQGRGGRYDADPQTLATSIDKVFVAGDCAGSGIAVEAMALGRKAAISVNRFLAGDDLKKDRDFESEYAFESKLDIPLKDDVEDLPRRRTVMIKPKERIRSFVECDFGFDGAAAMEESLRCLECECNACTKECFMLDDFSDNPGELFDRFLAEGDIDPLVPYSCNMCDQCTMVCPKEFKFTEMFVAMRQDLVKANNGQSPIPGHSYVDMHQERGFSDHYTVTIKGGKA
jgi:NADPH-dependent glutamate synthase beta subunit-like oxidoreductase